MTDIIFGFMVEYLENQAKIEALSDSLNHQNNDIFVDRLFRIRHMQRRNEFLSEFIAIIYMQ